MLLPGSFSRPCLMDLHDSPEDSAFRAEARAWLEANLSSGEFAGARGLGRMGLQHEGRETRAAWERRLGAQGWTCVGWPAEYGGRGLSVSQQVIWSEEYVRADAPARINVMGEGLLGPTLIAYGTEEQKRRFLPRICDGTDLWCQGYSEPDAGSDLANVQTRAVRDGDEWVITGQKVWTSYAQWADWCFVVCRTDPDAERHKGLSYLLVAMRQPGIEVRPIRQVTGTSEFNEVFFDGARTAADLVVGEVDDGWRVALATLAFERGVGLLGDVVGFRRELDQLVELARKSGKAADPVLRQRLADAWARLYILRLNTLRSLTGVDGPVAPPEASIAKLYWAQWHRDLGELAMDLLGTEATLADGLSAPRTPEDDATPAGYELGDLQRSFLFSRADTIYGGSNEIQRNIIGERVLGLPPEPRATAAKGDRSS
ncbi:MAG TPA: acyl-CoA dehydrogenase family protein [Acidimicrobiales bacterium]|nr:acyl-CoA dehydrogenase family protein [Acidimicrobiales bacterium]